MTRHRKKAAVYLELFYQHFKEVAERETRNVTVQEGNPWGVPGDEYALVESYCTDPDCDCRRVMLNVLARRQGPAATISFGFDPDGPMPGPFLDPINPQGRYAEQILALVKQVVLADPAYVARLERHYRMVKEKLAAPGAPEGRKRSRMRPQRPRRRRPK